MVISADIHTQQDLNEAKVHVPCRIASSQVPFQIHIIVFNYASNDIRGGDSWCSLHGHKPTHVLDVLVNVLRISTAIGNVVMCDKVNLEERDDVSPLANFYPVMRGASDKEQAIFLVWVKAIFLVWV